MILLLLQLLIIRSAEKLQSSVRTCLNVCSVLMQSRKRQVCAWVCNVCVQYVCTQQADGLVEVHLVVCVWGARQKETMREVHALTMLHASSWNTCRQTSELTMVMYHATYVSK